MRRSGEGSVAGRARLFYLVQPSGDAVVGGLTLAEATDLLADGLNRLPELAQDMEKGLRSSIPTRCSWCSTTTSPRASTSARTYRTGTGSSRR